MSNQNINKKFIEELFALHNKIREDPKSFIPYLKKELKHFDDDKNRIRTVGKETFSEETNEGKEAVLEAIDYLQKLKPVQKLKLQEELSELANDHALDLEENNLYESEGSDGRFPDQRIKERFDTKIDIGESITLTDYTAEDVVFSLIVDDGSYDRSSRANFFNTKFNFIGIGVTDHPDYDRICVIDYIGEILRIKPKINKKQNSGNFILFYLI